MNSLVCVRDYQRESRRRLSPAATGYYDSGALSQITLAENESAIRRWYIRPRCLRDVASRDLSTTILGHRVSVPFGTAPTAMQRMAHPEGECANARAASRMGTIFTLSTIATSSIEDVAAEGGDGIKFFQLYIYKDRKVTTELVRRAEKAGFKALVLTIDAPFFGIRYADMRNKFSLPSHLRMANFDKGDIKSDSVKSKGGSGINEYVGSLFDAAVTWKDVTWLKQITSLPIVLKGVLTAEDALLGLEAGVDAIWVSNHGARQIDGVLPSIDALPEVLEAVKSRCEVYADGGFRTGGDIFKALALGARMVFVGRPLVWGLACDGEEGAFNILKILYTELDSTMALAGCSSISKITRDMVSRNPNTLSKL